MKAETDAKITASEAKVDAKIKVSEEKCKQEQNDLKNSIDEEIKSINLKQSQDIENLKNETDQKIKDAIEAVINQMDENKWVIGEYRWMPVGSTMPAGWVKVAITKGLTLVQGDEKGKTKVAIMKHSHFFLNGHGLWSPGSIFYHRGGIILLKNII